MYTKEEIINGIQSDVSFIELCLFVISDNNYHKIIGRDKEYFENGIKWLSMGNHLSQKYISKCRYKLIRYWKEIQYLT